MPNVKTNRQILAGPKHVIQYLCIDSDGDEETDLVIYDSSAVATTLGIADPLNCKINSITYSTNSLLGVVKLEWDANTDVLAYALPSSGNSENFCFERFGGLPNTASTGRTGDITLTTTGLVAGDAITLIIDVSPQ